MDEQKLIKLLKQHFPSKKDYGLLRKDFEEFRSFVIRNVATKKEFVEFKDEMMEFKNETRQSFYNMGISLKSIEDDVKEIREDIDEIKPSVEPLDKILEQCPVERITRLEKHAKLSPFVPAVWLGKNISKVYKHFVAEAGIDILKVREGVLERT